MFPQLSVPQPPGSLTMEQSIQSMMATLSALNNKIDFFMKEMSELKSRVETAENDVKHAYKEIYALKDQVNTFDQRDRALVIRIFGLPPSTDEKESVDSAKFAAKNVYDRILRPILSHAKDKALIPTLPGLDKVIAEAFRLKPRNSAIAKPPPIVVKLTNSAIKSAIFRAKKESLPQPTPHEIDSGLRRFHLAEDLTPASYNFLMELRGHEKVERAWTVDGEIRFTKKGDSTSFVHKVKSIFEGLDCLFT